MLDQKGEGKNESRLRSRTEAIVRDRKRLLKDRAGLTLVPVGQKLHDSKAAEYY